MFLGLHGVLSEINNIQPSNSRNTKMNVFTFMELHGALPELLTTM
jgi:hypothetical protein